MPSVLGAMAAVLISVFAWAASASAQSWTVVSPPPAVASDPSAGLYTVLLAGPEMTSDGAVWWALRRPDDGQDIYRATAGAAPVLVGVLPGIPGGSPGLTMTASGTRVLIDQSGGGCGGSSADDCMHGGAPPYFDHFFLAGPGPTLSTAPVPGGDITTNPTFSGDMLGYDGTSGYAFENLNDLSAPAVTLPASIAGNRELSLAWPWVLGFDGELTAGGFAGQWQLFHLPDDHLQFSFASDADGFPTIDTDGTLVFHPPNGTAGELGWVSPSQSTVEPLPDLQGDGCLQIAGDLIAACSEQGYLVSNLSGQIVAPSVAPGPDVAGNTSFDGSALAWADQPCVVPQIDVWDIASAGPPPADHHCTAPTITGPRHTVHASEDQIRVQLTCPAAATATGCPGTLTLNRTTTIAGTRRPVGRVLGQTAYYMSPGATNTLTLSINHAGRLLLQRSARTLLLTATAYRDLYSPSPHPTSRTRSPLTIVEILR